MTIIQYYVTQNPAFKLAWGLYPRRRHWLTRLVRFNWPALIMVIGSFAYVILIMFLTNMGWGLGGPAVIEPSMLTQIYKMLFLMSFHCFTILWAIQICVFPRYIQDYNVWHPELYLAGVDDLQIRFGFISPSLFGVAGCILFITFFHALTFNITDDEIGAKLPWVGLQYFYLLSIPVLSFSFLQLKTSRLKRFLLLLFMMGASFYTIFNMEVFLMLKWMYFQQVLVRFNQWLTLTMADFEYLSVTIRATVLLLLARTAIRNWHSQIHPPEPLETETNPKSLQPSP